MTAFLYRRNKINTRFKHFKIAKYIVNNLKELNAYIKNMSKYGTIYIAFKNNELLRQIRIGDHDGREKYKYKWNLRNDIPKEFIDIDKGISRYYYTFFDVDKLINDIKNKYKQLQENNYVCKDKKM